MNETIMQSLIATGYGMSGVFLVLILFYILTKLMMALFSNLPSNKDE